MQCGVELAGIMNSRNVNEHHHRRGRSFNGITNIHLFNTNSSHVSGKLPKLSFESARLDTSGIDDLLSSTRGGKHDYDWLLTPPGTPHLASSEGESQPTSVPPRSSLGRSTSNTNASRLSVSQSQNNSQSHSRPTRSSSVTRSSNKLNASPASVSSRNRPSSPITITRSPSTLRPTTPSSTRPSTPSRIPSRPSTPTSASNSRRHSMPSQFPTTSATGTATRVGRRPQAVVPPDFPLETPPNLRTTLPDRPVSAGRSRPGAVVTLPLKPNSETQAMSRRHPSPIANRGRLSELTGKGRAHVNPNANANANAKANSSDGRLPLPHASKSVKSSPTSPDNHGLGLGRTLSKKSLDMAIRHMDIRNSSGTPRSLSSATLFPQSIRTSTPKAQHTRGLSAPASVNMNGKGTSKMNERQYFARFMEVDAYESSRYDSLLVKEDFNSTNWLLSVDDKCDQRPIFDNGFESLPEPFGLL
ncbi:cell wall protein DAN4-like [Abrus precatorius]|uniref:Cell wall protein DAN4-like n=1 Tax=Abrus precatorius TaxID=3816 RepID=A0A8B8JZZ8_ABRPR|nr:cell wall protein DAN4-like [Abrus precatorius]